MTKRKRRNLILLNLLLAVTLLLCMGTSATLAWLSDETNTLENTFTYGDIHLALEETKTDEKGVPELDADNNPVKTTAGNTYSMLPEESYLKDPVVTVKAGSEACWLFVKLTESGGFTDGSGTVYGFDDFLTYQVEDGWTKLQGGDSETVYFRLVEADAAKAGTAYAILKNHQISVIKDVTKDMLNGLDNNGKDKANATYPKLELKAYAIQHSGFEAEGTPPTTEQTKAAAETAWSKIKDSYGSTTP
ncbi:MAG: SipW-dependent-type signal peptide-containing protein [Firmicutes bacterium]|nr:SipW-dependent-type signal peptide-containing protein [Bacillota bacterium]